MCPYHGEGHFLCCHLGYRFRGETGAGSGFVILFFVRFFDNLAVPVYGLWFKGLGFKD